MKLKIHNKKEKSTPSTQDYINLIQCLIDDIRDFEGSIVDLKGYEGIISTRTAPKLKILFPKIYNDLDLK